MEGREAGDGCTSYYNLSYSCQITTLLWFTFGDKEGPGAVHLSHGVLPFFFFLAFLVSHPPSQSRPLLDLTLFVHPFASSLTALLVRSKDW